MTERVYLHVGAPKSGTTYLQQVLRTNHEALGAAGVRVVGATHVDLVHAGMVDREDPRLAQLPPRAGRAWQRVVDEVRAWPGDSAIISYELFAGATEEQAARAIADLHGSGRATEVHVVITARDFARAVPSAWQERLKFALTTPLEEWEAKPETVVRSEWGWRTLDPAGVARRWGASLPADRVHVVTVPRGHAPGELWRRFAEACAIEEDVEFPAERANASLGAGAAELLRRVNEHAADVLTTNREQARWLRDLLAHEILVPLDDEPIGLTDAQYADAVERNAAARAELEAAGYSLHGDLDDLTPSRPAARTPGQVPAEDVLNIAARAILSLVLKVRDQQAAVPAAQAADVREARPGLLQAGRNLVKGAPARRLLAENQRLAARVGALEQELARARSLQNRVAMVTDVVQELLLPEPARDRDSMITALRNYRQESL